MPVFFPIVGGPEFGLGGPARTPIRFAIVFAAVIAIGPIVPPSGPDAFAPKSLLPEAPLSTIFRGVAPFIIADSVRVAVPVALPIRSPFLPDPMTSKR